jgi:uncharacterized membrane protein
MIARSAALVALLALAGCDTVGELAGLVTGGSAGVATASPVVGIAVGIAVTTATTEALKYYGRHRQQAEQNAIAEVAGTLPEGGAAPWRIRHDIPIGNEHGEVRVVRVIATPLAECREIVFSVVDLPDPSSWYSSSICHQAARWKWAEAEPAVERWGYLQ